MPIKKILFYAQVYFLDNALEHVKLLLENGYEVHVLINLSPNQQNANILQLNVDLNSYEGLVPFQKIRNTWKVNYMASYLENCKSVNFAVFPSKRLSSTLRVSRQIGNLIKSLAVDYIHLDEFSNRHLFLLPSFVRYRKKLLLNIHDPVNHSGEKRFMLKAYRKILFRLVPIFVVFSKHSEMALKEQIPKTKKIVQIRLLPYSVYKKFLKNDSQFEEKKFISFVGRISPYKGVELFTEAIDMIQKKFSKQQFIIAGKAIAGYSPEFLNIKKKNTEVRNKFLSNKEMADIINKSKLIICPYIDATQSGVIMTAYALGCPVLVTNTGGLPEYVLPEKTGIIVNGVTSEVLSEGMKRFLIENDIKNMQEYLDSLDFEKKCQGYITEKLPYLYP